MKRTDFVCIWALSCLYLEAEKTNPVLDMSNICCESTIDNNDKDLSWLFSANMSYKIYLFFQARNVVTKEIVAIKKMSYNGKQATEVREQNDTSSVPPYICARGIVLRYISPYTYIVLGTCFHTVW